MPPVPARRAALVRVAFGLALAAAACAHRHEEAPPTPPPGIHRLLVFPLNVVVPMPTGLESGAASVSEALSGWLTKQHFSVESYPGPEARTAWASAAQELREELGAAAMSFEGAARVLARTLHHDRAFDALVLPWLALRAARLKEASASWDGVKRKVGFFALGKSKRASWVIDRLDLWVKAPSLEVLGVSAQGEKLFEGVGGLDLVDEAELDLSASKIRFDMVPKEKIFDDLPHLREGIALALAPLLPLSGAREERPGAPAH